MTSTLLHIREITTDSFRQKAKLLTGKNYNTARTALSAMLSPDFKNVKSMLRLRIGVDEYFLLTPFSTEHLAVGVIRKGAAEFSDLVEKSDSAIEDLLRQAEFIE